MRIICKNSILALFMLIGVWIGRNTIAQSNTAIELSTVLSNVPEILGRSAAPDSITKTIPTEVATTLKGNFAIEGKPISDADVARIAHRIGATEIETLKKNLVAKGLLAGDSSKRYLTQSPGAALPDGHGDPAASTDVSSSEDRAAGVQTGFLARTLARFSKSSPQTTASSDGKFAAQTKLSPAARAEWESVTSALTSAAENQHSGPEVSASIDSIIRQHILEATTLPETMTEADARTRLQQLERFDKPNVSVDGRRRVRAAMTALTVFLEHRTSTIQMDPVADRDSLNARLGLPEENPALRSSLVNAAKAKVDEALTRLNPADQFAVIRNLARSAMWQHDLPVPQPLQDRLIHNNEWSSFNADLSLFAIEKLHAMGTPDANAEIALETIANVRATGNVWVSEKAREALQGLSPDELKAVGARAIEMLKQPPFADRDSEPWTGVARRAMTKLAQTGQLSPH